MNDDKQEQRGGAIFDDGYAYQHKPLPQKSPMINFGGQDVGGIRGTNNQFADGATFLSGNQGNP